MAAGAPKFKVMRDVVDLLKADTTMQEFVGSKIFPIVAPQNTTGDFIAYQRDGVDTEPLNKMGGFASLRFYFYISIVSTDYERSLDIADRVYDVLQGTHETFSIEFKDSTENVVDQKFIQVLKFSIL